MRTREPDGFDGDALAYWTEVIVELRDDVEDARGHGEADCFCEVGGEERVGGYEGGEGGFCAEGGALVELCGVVRYTS